MLQLSDKWTICKKIYTCLQSFNIEFKDRVKKLVKTPASLSKLNQNKTTLYDKIKKHETVEELLQINVKFLNKLPAKELQSFFDFEMHDIQQRPALLLDKVISISSPSISTLMKY